MKPISIGELPNVCGGVASDVQTAGLGLHATGSGCGTDTCVGCCRKHPDNSNLSSVYMLCSLGLDQSVCMQCSVMLAVLPCDFSRL